ncbi:MAG: adenine deaminase C-terminal domain-containing protein [Spirochaetales bacterium]
MTPCDLVLTDARIVDVFRLRVFRGWIGIRKGTFLYVEEGDPPPSIVSSLIPSVKDLPLCSVEGRYLCPGLIDSHMHIESSLLTPRRFAEAVLPHGTTTVLADPHEVANAAGAEGLHYFLNSCTHLPLDIRIALPSCVPATSPDLEWTPEVFDSATLEAFKTYLQVIALGEVMDYRRLLFEVDKETGMLYTMIQKARHLGWLVEGHVPTLEGLELSEYIASGIGSDHTLTHPKKLLEQLSKGLTVMLQAKSLTPEVVQTVQTLLDRSRILLVTDDIEPSLLAKGHLSSIVRLAIAQGMDAIDAIASATVRPARYLGLERGAKKKGGIAPGYVADFLILSDLKEFFPEEVWVMGKQVGAKGIYVGPDLSSFILSDESLSSHASARIALSPQLPGPFTPEDFTLPTSFEGRQTARVVHIKDARTSITELHTIPVQIEHGFPCWKEEAANCCAISIIARNNQSRSFALLQNLGLTRGGVASSFAHDSHNLLVLGRSAEEMAQAANEVYRRGGGVAVVAGKKLLAFLPLAVFGLLSDAPVAEVAEQLEQVEVALKNLGIKRERPFLILSLLSLSVSPYAKITDRGIVNTENRVVLSPFF